MTTATATFKKLRSGEWGIRVTGAPPEVGTAVEVTLSGGGTKTVTVSKVVATFPEACLCEIVGYATNVPAAATQKDAWHLPTDEQKNALALFATGESLAIEAGAGTGKTTTLVLLAQSTRRRGQYVAFNRAIVQESKTKMPANVECNTAHSLAMKAIGFRFKNRLDRAARMKSLELAKVLRLEAVKVTAYTGEEKRLGAPFLAGVVMAALERFCTTADPEPTWRHVKRIEGLDAPATRERPATYPVNEYVARAVEPAMRRAWKDLMQFEGALPYRHSYYLKLWQLSKPRINVDFILFDEAQDASLVMIDIVAQQQDHAQLVWVGDSQQQIYSFTGAINALATVPAEQRAFLSQSFRFGQRIADLANVPLTALKAELRLTGFDKIASTVAALTEPRAVLTRTNAAAIRAVLDALGRDKKPYLVGGGADIVSFVKAADELMRTGHTDHPELACFDSWSEVQSYVEEDEQGGDLRLMVDLIDEFGVDRILEALESTATEEQADVVVSTAHKAKGREWDTVQLGGDFKDNPEGEELRLLYVAVTRAKLIIDITAVPYFNTVNAPVQA